MTWVCIDCGARQEAGGRCAACGHDDTCDLRDPKVLELMRDVDERRMNQLEGRLRFVGVLVGMAVVFAMWFIPGYWDYERVIALPVLMDQWLLMAVIGFGVQKLLQMAFAKKRFPYLGDDLRIH